MTQSKSRISGFTAVELLVTLVVALLFIITFYQLYTVAVTDSNDARYRAAAGNIAYTALRDTGSKITRPCSALSPAPSTPIPPNTLPTPNSQTISITCPYGTGSDVSRISVTVKYGTPEQEVIHVIYKS